MAKLFRTVAIHEPKKHGTTIGRKPITSTMNKHKRRSFKKYRGQGKRWTVNFFDKNNCHIIIGVNFMTSHKYIYGQGSHTTNIKGLQ